MKVNSFCMQTAYKFNILAFDKVCASRMNSLLLQIEIEFSISVILQFLFCKELCTNENAVLLY